MKTDRYLPQVDFLLNDFAARVPGITHAVAISGDGMLLAGTHDLPSDAKERLAAIGSGLVSLLRGAAGVLSAGAVRQNVAHMDGGFLISMAIDGNAPQAQADSRASLLVLARADCDMGHVVEAMVLLVDRVGPALIPELRGALTIPAVS